MGTSQKWKVAKIQPHSGLTLKDSGKGGKKYPVDRTTGCVPDQLLFVGGDMAQDQNMYRLIDSDEWLGQGPGKRKIGRSEKTDCGLEACGLTYGSRYEL